MNAYSPLLLDSTGGLVSLNLRLQRHDWKLEEHPGPRSTRWRVWDLLPVDEFQRVKALIL